MGSLMTVFVVVVVGEGGGGGAGGAGVWAGKVCPWLGETGRRPGGSQPPTKLVAAAGKADR